jgi:hypothetical protein
VAVVIVAMFPTGSTVNAIVAVAVLDPEVPITVCGLTPSLALPSAVKVRIEVTVPFAGGVTWLDENHASNPQFCPQGERDTLSETGELNPFSLVTVTVLETSPPCCTVTELGDAETLKPGPSRTTVTATAVTAAVFVPEVLSTVTVLVLTVADDVAVNVRVEVTVPFAGGVTGFGENDTVSPLGRPAAMLNVVAELNPFLLVTVTVLVAVAPCCTLTVLGDAETLMPGVPGFPEPEEDPEPQPSATIAIKPRTKAGAAFLPIKLRTFPFIL